MKRTKQNRQRSRKLSKEAVESLKAAERRFFEALRRPPHGTDRIFYWSYCYSDNEFKNNTIKSMLQANIPQHLIYIYDKTGFMVNKQGYSRLSK